MVDLVRLVLLVLASAITWIALLSTLPYLIPARADRAELALEQRPGRAFLLGLVNVIFFGLLAALLAQGGQFLGLIALLILLVLLAFTMSGLAGMIMFLRVRIERGEASETRPALRQQVKAAAILVLACLAPIGGWFALLPIALITSLGAGIMAQSRRSDLEKPIL